MNFVHDHIQMEGYKRAVIPKVTDNGRRASYTTHVCGGYGAAGRRVPIARTIPPLIDVVQSGTPAEVKTMLEARADVPLC